MKDMWTHKCPAYTDPVSVEKGSVCNFCGISEDPHERAQFYIEELKEFVSWTEYLQYLKEQDTEAKNFKHFCMQMWANYMENELKQKKDPLTYNEYIGKFSLYLKKTFKEHLK
jgi:hypothetical protein